MSTVAFIGGYNLSRSTTFRHTPRAAVDIMNDGTPQQRLMSTEAFLTISCLFEYLTATEKLILEIFLLTNAANTITWTIDGVNYSGVFLGGHSVTMTGPLFNVSFDYYAQIV